MFKLIYNGNEVAVAPGPFVFNETGMFWVSDGQHLYDPARVVTQVAVDEPDDVDFQSDSLVAPVAPKDLTVTVLAYRNRFTAAEKVAIEMAALDDPAAEMAARKQAAEVRVFLQDLATAKFIDLTDEATRAGAIYLEAGGLLAEGRALEILDAPIQDKERI